MEHEYAVHRASGCLDFAVLRALRSAGHLPITARIITDELLPDNYTGSLLTTNLASMHHWRENAQLR